MASKVLAANRRSKMTQTNSIDAHQAATFMARMIPFLATGLSFEDAGKAVLARDRELMNSTLAATEEGAAIRRSLAEGVYSSVRAQ
jgi:hypothetical protein